MFISPNKREIVGLPPVMDKYRSIYIMTFSSKTMKKNPLMVACITQVYFDIAIVLSIILLKKKNNNNCVCCSCEFCFECEKIMYFCGCCYIRYLQNY